MKKVTAVVCTHCKCLTPDDEVFLEADIEVKAHNIGFQGATVPGTNRSLINSEDKTNVFCDLECLVGFITDKLKDSKSKPRKPTKRKPRRDEDDDEDI